MKRFRHNGMAAALLRRLFPWLSVAGLVLLSAGIQGTPGEREDEAERQPEASEEAKPASGENDGDSDEVFQPTEEISEDFAVPFPVDI